VFEDAFENAGVCGDIRGIFTRILYIYRLNRSIALQFRPSVTRHSVLAGQK